MSSETAAQSATRQARIRGGGHEQRSGPRRVALHRSVRAATVIPATFATSLGVTHDVQIATFAVFGCFSLLVMADFGGRRPARAVAYVVTACTGATLVAIGTLASPNAAVGAAVMLVVALGVSFAAVFGGYIAAAQTALLLAFVLAVALPAPVSAIPTRLAGWALAGVVSTLAGVFLWPWFERVALRKRAAEAILATADVVTALRRSPSADELNGLRDAARGAIQAIRSEYARTAMRPAGPARHDRAFVELVTELEQIVDISEAPFNEERPQRRPCIDEGDALTAAVTAALRQSAAALAGSEDTPDIRAVEAARRAHREALDRWAVDELRGGRTAEAVLAGIDADHTLRVVAYLTMALGANAAITVGGRPVEGFPLPVAIPTLEGARGTGLRIARTLRAHLDPSSTVLHNSLRVAVGLALSVLLAKTLGSLTLFGSCLARSASFVRTRWARAGAPCRRSPAA